MTGIGAGYKVESQEARALASITVDSYDYRDQAKLLTKLTSDVSYLAQYNRQMQKGIDAANSNFIEQITDFINEVATVIGGLGNTGIDLGDLKYVLEAMGALFGFDSATGIAGILPINLIDAAWHFVKSYVLGTDAETPGEYFDWLIDQILTTALDWLGEIPIVGTAVETIAMWVTQSRDAIKATVNLLLSWSTPILQAIKNGVDAFNQIFGAWTAPIADWFYASMTWLMEIFGDWTGAIVDWIYNSVTWVVNLFGGWTGPFVTWISNSLTGLMEIFGEWSVAIANWVRNTLTWLGNLFYEWTLPFVTWLTDTVHFLGDVFADWSAAIATWIHDSVAWLTALLAEWTAPFVTAITSVVSFVTDAFGDWSASIAAWIHESVTWLSNMFDAWDGPFADMVKGAIAVIQQIVDWFTGTVGAAFEMLFPWAKKLPQMQIVDGAEVLKTSNVPSLDASKIGSGTFGAPRIADDSISTTKLSDYAITNSKLGSNAVTAPKLSDYAVENAKIYPYAVSGDKVSGIDASKVNSGTFGEGRISDGAITNLKLAQFAVNTNNIVNDAINNAKLAGDSVSAAELQDLAVITAKLATDAVTNAKVAPDAISSTELQNLAVQTAKLAQNAVSGEKLQDLDGSKVKTGKLPIAVVPTDDIGKALTTTGSGAMLIRTTAGVQGVSQGLNYIPANFFNTYSYKTGDINFISSNQGMQVTYAGWYMVELAYKLNAIATWGWNFAPVLRVSGGGDKYGTDCLYTWGGVPISASSGAQRCVQNSFIVYLGNGGVVYAGYDCTMGAGFGDTNVLGGGSSAQTYFSISLLNRSYA